MFGKRHDDLQDELDSYYSGQESSSVPDEMSDEKSDDFDAQAEYNKYAKVAGSAQQQYSGDVLWEGMSAKGAGAVPKLFAIYWLGFSLVWTFFAMMGSVLFALFGLPFIFIGIFMLARSNEKFRYKITQSHVIISNIKNTKTIPLTALHNINFVMDRKNMDLGTVSFETTIVTKDANGTHRYEETEVLANINDPQAVYNILSNAAAAAQGR